METLAIIVYGLVGCWSIGYIKRDVLGWITFTSSIGNYYIVNFGLGLFFGFITIPFALIHMLFFSKK